VSRPVTAEAAATAGCSPATAQRARRRWRDRIESERDARAEELAAGLLDLAGEALTQLRGLLRSPSDAVRFGAARFTLESALRWRDSIAVESRLQRLEDRLDAEGDGRAA